MMASDSSRGGETGRRTGLKIPGLPKGRAGSIPAPGTSTFNHNKQLVAYEPQPVEVQRFSDSLYALGL